VTGHQPKVFVNLPHQPKVFVCVCVCKVFVTGIIPSESTILKSALNPVKLVLRTTTGAPTLSRLSPKPKPGNLEPKPGNTKPKPQSPKPKPRSPIGESPKQNSQTPKAKLSTLNPQLSIPIPQPSTLTSTLTREF
jgi:hypothetical protein